MTPTCDDQSAATGPCVREWKVLRLGPRRRPLGLDIQQKNTQKCSKVDKSKLEHIGPRKGELRQHQCISCSRRRRKCIPDPKTTNGPCYECAHLTRLFGTYLPCWKYEITGASLFRDQDAPSQGFSTRWSRLQVGSITEWTSSEVKTVYVTHGIGDARFVLQVRQFVPYPEDAMTHTWHDWNDGDTVKKRPAAPYAIADVETASRELRTYLDRCIEQVVSRPSCWLPAIVRKTFQHAFHFANIATRPTDSSVVWNSLRLWVAVQMSSNIEWICGGDKIDSAVDDRSSPYFNRIPVPPLMNAQLEAIVLSRLLRPLQQDVLSKLKVLITSADLGGWFPVYLSMFIICHSCSLTTRRDEQFARRCRRNTRYANGSSISEHHHGIMNLLAHFHSYYGKWQRNLWKPPPNQFDLQPSVNVPMLPEHCTELVEDSVSQINDNSTNINACRQTNDFGHDFYFLSQLFDNEWAPSKIASPTERIPQDTGPIQNIGTVIIP